jgi:hypothetical protein
VDFESPAKREARTTGDDFDSALDQAELLLQEADRTRYWTRFVRAAQLGLPIIVALALTITIGTHDLTANKAFLTVAICGLITAPIVGWIELAIIVPAKRRISRDERAMLDIIGMLRELLVSIAADEGWSAVRQRLTKARIARFPIGSRSFR